MYLLHQQVAYTRKQNTYLKQYMYLTVLTSVNIMLTSLQQMTCEERAERKSSSDFWPQVSVASLNFRKTHVASLTFCCTKCSLSRKGVLLVIECSLN